MQNYTCFMEGLFITFIQLIFVIIMMIMIQQYINSVYHINRINQQQITIAIVHIYNTYILKIKTSKYTNFNLNSNITLTDTYMIQKQDSRIINKHSNTNQITKNPQLPKTNKINSVNNINISQSSSQIHHHNSPPDNFIKPDQVYILQNQNEVLQLKNIELNEQIQLLRSKYTLEMQKLEELQLIYIELQHTYNNPNPLVNIHNERKLLNDKIKSLQHNLVIWENKISEVQRAIVAQQQQHLIPLTAHIEQAEVELWRLKMQNQGMKVVIRNIQSEIDSLKKQSPQLIKNPKKKQSNEVDNTLILSQEIQYQVHSIKQQQSIIKQNSKNLAAKLLVKYLHQFYNLHFSMFCINFMKNFDFLEHQKKKLSFAFNFHKSYIKSVKYRTLNVFKNLLESKEQQQRIIKIMSNSQKLKQKSNTFSKWRKQFIKTQFLIVRKLEAVSVLEKIENAFRKTLLFNSFNILALFRSKFLTSVHHITQCISHLRNRHLSNFFQKLKNVSEFYKLEHQIQHHSKNQTQFLIKSIYFTAFSLYHKAQKTCNKTILAKFFKILKKTKNNNKKRELNNILDIILEKQNFNKCMVTAFSAFKYATIKQMQYTMQDFQTQVTKENSSLQSSLNRQKNLYGSDFFVLAFAKLGIILNKTLKKGFYKWRRRNYRLSKLLQILEMFQTKQYNDMNLGFSNIQTKRFQKLKASIKDKIESCEFSYNYLTRQNTHIKEVLDKKTLELEKHKFVQILKRIILDQHNVLLKFFRKFNRRSIKVYLVKLHTRRIQHIVNNKIKMLFLYFIREEYQHETREKRVTYHASILSQRLAKRLLFTSLDCFKLFLSRKKKISKILNFISQRNLELLKQKSFFLLKDIYQRQCYKNQSKNLIEDQTKLSHIQQQIIQYQQQNKTLKEKLEDRSTHYKERVIISLRKFFIQRIKIYGTKYIKRWRKKNTHITNLMEFAKTLQIKFRCKYYSQAFNGIKMHVNLLNRRNLEQKYNKFIQQYENGVNDFNNLTIEIENKIKIMLDENLINQKFNDEFKKKLSRMDLIKTERFKTKWGKTFNEIILRKWKKRIESDRRIYTKFVKRLKMIAFRLNFYTFYEILQNETKKKRIKRSIARIYHKKYQYNTNYFFSVWRSHAHQLTKIICIKKMNDHNLLKLRGQENLSSRILKFQDLWSYPYIHNQLRNTFSKLNRYTQIKSVNKKLKKQFEIRLHKIHKIEFIDLLSRMTKKSRLLKHKLFVFEKNHQQRIKNALFFGIKKLKTEKLIFSKIFLKRFIDHHVFNIFIDSFSNIKLFQRRVEINLQNQYAFRTQKFIELWNKKYMVNIGKAFKIWRKKGFIISLQKNLFKRLTRKATNLRIQKIFLSWKLETQARNVIHFHKTQGQIKKRHIQFQRTKKYIEEFKKLKGLLLQNEEGNLVIEPKILQKKEVQQKKENQLRYKLISRLLLFANGEHNAIKAWNNLYIFYLIRTKYKKAAITTLNYIRNPDKFQAFRLWREFSYQSKQYLQSIPRVKLIKVLQHLKDKIEVEYGQKLANEQNMQIQLQRFQRFEFQNQIKQKLCGFVLIRSLRNKLSSAFSKWHKCIYHENDEQDNTLELHGSERTKILEQEIRALQQQYLELVRINHELKDTAIQGIQIADAVKSLTIQRDHLNEEIQRRKITCEALFEQNIILTNRFNLASQQAIELMNLTQNSQ